jgi:death-on-curing protein
MLVSLDSNGLMLTSNEEQLFRLVLRLAQHRLVPQSAFLADREVLWISAWIVENSRSVEKGERPVQWRRLKQILTHFGCGWEYAKVGNRLNITREVSGSGRWGRRTQRLSVQVKFTDDGREAYRGTLHEIRRGLHLDEEHGVDSASFYGEAGYIADEFILRYRKLLKRLSRL